MGFLLSEPKFCSCTRLSEVMDISHDSVNRFLLRESYEPKDLFDEAKRLVNLAGGTVSCDDTTLDKPYIDSQINNFLPTTTKITP